MRKLLLLLIIPFLFSCEEKKSIIGEWAVYQNLKGASNQDLIGDREFDEAPIHVGDVTFNSDNTLTVDVLIADANPVLYRSWEGGDTNLCINDDGEMICVGLTWINNDLFHTKQEGVGYKTTYKRKK